MLKGERFDELLKAGRNLPPIAPGIEVLQIGNKGGQERCYCGEAGSVFGGNGGRKGLGEVGSSNGAGGMSVLAGFGIAL